MSTVVQGLSGREERTDAGLERVLRRPAAARAGQNLAYVSPPEPGDVHRAHHFLRQLHLEKRRSDRSKSPLSIVVFRHESQQDGEPEDTRELLGLLSDAKRETDLLGHLGGAIVALLLPDTSAEGARRFLAKLTARSGEMPFAVEVATYPDELFNELTDGSQGVPDDFPIRLESSWGRKTFYEIVKRLVDVCGALVGLIGLSPIFLAVAVAIKLTSPGPVIFKQTRLGRKGAPFTFYKFRSMLANSDDQIHRDYVTNLIKGAHDDVNQGDQAAPYFKLSSDPRVTSVGRFIRKTSIDELPQFWNVLKGDMSLVGPRPPLEYEVRNYQSWHLRRILEVRPGITGLWQVYGRSRTTFDDMVRLDLTYIREQRLGLDVKILLKTIAVVLGGDGAS